MAERVLTVEDLAPRSQVVKTMEMAVRRAKALGVLCREALDAAYGDPALARRLHPWGGDYPARERDFIFGEPSYRAARLYTDWWPMMWDAWYSGSLDRQIECGLANLPLSVREKL